MVAHISTVAFRGVEALEIDVQVQMSPGLPAFTIVGLPDKAVAESRERVRAALTSLGLGLPPKRITVNLAPADLPKEGSHFDLSIALGLLAVSGAISADSLREFTVLGELSLDGSVLPVAGVLPAALSASSHGRGLICPHQCGPEAAWAGEELDILAPTTLLQLINHFKGTQMLSRPHPEKAIETENLPDLCDIKGQEMAKRALEVAAAGGHNMLMIGPPGAGKSMLASRMPSILPLMEPSEMLEVSTIASVAGSLEGGKIGRRRPFRSPHHSASMPALVGGGLRAKPGEVSLAHMGVLFLDELPEFSVKVLDSLRQPLETGQTSIARANHHVTYPSRFQFLAAMNPCRCGMAGEPGHTCKRGRKCAEDYQGRISGPLLDRIDLRIEVPAVKISDLSLPKPQETSADVAKRVMRARRIQQERFEKLDAAHLRTNTELDGALLEQAASPEKAGLQLLQTASENMNLSARGYHRVLRVARTLADLDGVDIIQQKHIAESLSYRGLGLAKSLAA